jgi:hypothetical protein
MRNWLFLSKKGQDEYINMLAQSVGVQPTDSDLFDYYYDVKVDNRVPVLRGILKYKIMHQCLEDRRDFFYVDSGYLGNHTGPGNRRGDKLYHRIVKNDLQSNQIIASSPDRWEKLQLKLLDRRYGRKIIVAAPDEKPCRYYKINREQWLKDTVEEIKKHTDRAVIVRERAAKRVDRTVNDPLSHVLANDVHCLVTYNSIAAVEAILQGVPAIVLAPTHAAQPVAGTKICDIENPVWADRAHREAWAHSLAYQQFHVREMRDGTAMRMIDQ